MRPLVIIPVKNHLEFTAPLVRALWAQSVSAGDADLIVYDNGSTDQTREWLGEFGVECVDTKGWTLHQMWNDGLNQADPQQPVVILNNDLKLDGKPDWLGRLCKPFKGGWGALCPNYDARPTYRAVDSLEKKGVSGGVENGKGGLSGFAFAMSPQVVGWYRFPADLKWWFGDTDLVWALEANGYQCGLVADVGVTHLGGGSQTAKDYDLNDICKKDHATWRAKWRPEEEPCEAS